MGGELGGYIELEQYRLPMRYEDGVLLNSGRAALLYLIKAKHIKKILIPWLCCDSVRNICLENGCSVRQYDIKGDFFPCDIDLQNDEWIYIVKTFMGSSRRGI